MNVFIGSVANQESEFKWPNSPHVLILKEFQNSVQFGFQARKHTIPMNNLGRNRGMKSVFTF